MGALIVIFTGALVVLFAGLFAKRSILQGIGLVTALGGLVLSLVALNSEVFDLRHMLIFDHYALAFTALMCLATFLVFLASGYGFRQLGETLGDNYGLILFSLCGGICMVSFQNMVMLFLGIEILSIPLYVLAGSRRNDLGSNEASLKYFLMGAFATGILLMGMALLYGATGTFDVVAMGEKLTSGGLSGYGYIGFMLLTIGLCFKISAAPFHFWSPDVYQGSPTIITAFMASVVKIAGFGALVRIFSISFVGVAGEWMTMLGAIACLTMTVGNFGALMQSNFKRLLAYSSISHAGYLLLGVVSLQYNSVSSVFYYLTAYSIATIVAFTIFMLISEQKASENISVFNGLAKRKPLLAFAMTVALLSMAGIPPLAGFFGKYFLFTKALEANPFMVIVAVINSAISIAYYFKPITAMYFTKEEDVDNEVLLPGLIKTSIVLSLCLLVIMVIFPGWLQGLVG